MITIRDVKTILTAPEGINLVVVKIETSEPGLYGLGCATFTQRYLTVASAIDDYMKPFLIGKDVNRIEDIWQTAMVSGYWRNGPEFNNALSGVDMALWDIKGKLANMPLYELLGGKCREGAAIYKHADGGSKEEVEQNVRASMEQGYRYVRCQMGLYGGKGQTMVKPDNALDGVYYDPKAYMRGVAEMFEHIRGAVGWEVELIHDVHERLTPIDAVAFAKQLEPFRLFYLEDALPPEQIEWFKMIRQHSAIPIAMGELFNNPNEWMPLISNRLIDFIRIHVSQIGGITPAKKLVSLSEAFGVRTAWHGPGDVSPVGHAANVHLDVSSINFGIQEWNGFQDTIHEVFPGCPESRDGYVYPNDKPGLGIDIDEKAAAKFPCSNVLPTWTMARLPDGTSARP
ncbi:enolase C-terminal domain-like protein [Paenibacillus thalictri]|uniref:Starvation-sensing protein RspA n=1 Tax=Paenibacillus thalictri TaxID=2527873 RepID=A0A4Q9DHA3_9BACL|nr:enolase C-terminal domain-like protein [Paenibacillus thalictri]TBL70090.1 starvation-sensing protein RspA [Paenibacillus thalictri]